MFSRFGSTKFRRWLIRRVGVSLAGVGIVLLLAACASGATSAPATAPAPVAPSPTAAPTAVPATPTTAPTAAPASPTAAPSAPAAASPASSAAVSAKFFTATSTKSFADTVSALKKAVSGAGMMVLGNLNQAGALSAAGLHLKGAETFFVGNPTIGKMFFQADPAVAAVLPLRVYVWVNSSGQTEVGYLDPASLMSAVDQSLAASAQKLSMAASMIAKGATGSAPSASATLPIHFVTVSSGNSFSDTLAKVKTSTSSAAMMVLGSLNQAGALSAAGVHLKGAQSFFVGNPTNGKMLFQTDPAVGIAIPVGIYVWVNNAGNTEIGYFDPAPILGGINSMLAKPGQMLGQAASKIANGAAK